MCKLLIMAGLNPNKNELTWKFAKLMGEVMSEHNDDGLGYAAVDAQGNLFGERWLYNEEAFQNRNRFTKPRKVDKKKIELLQKEYGQLLNIEPITETVSVEKYGTFGTLNPKIAAITLHARAASTEVCYKNVHPFVDEKLSISVIHNGYISNHDKDKDFIRSTCDSERILNQYIEHEVNKIPVDIQNLIDSLTGSFACGVFAKDKNGKRILDIFRTTRPLGAVFVNELGCMVYSTRIEDVLNVCSFMGLTYITKPDLIQEDKLFRIDPVTGKLLLSVGYRDTTKYLTTQYRGGRTHEQYHQSWEENAKAERERNAVSAVTVNQNNDGPKEAPQLTLIAGGRKLTEEDKAEMADLKLAGLDEEDIADYIERKYAEAEIVNDADRDYREEEIIHIMKEHGWDRRTAETFVENQIRSASVAKELKEAKEIVEQAFNDTLNQDEAANDNWAFDKRQGVWTQRPKH